MTRRLAALVTAVAVSTACTAPAPDRGTGDRCDPRLDDALAAWADAGFSGSVAIADGGTIVCRAGYGSADDEAGRPNTADTVFSIGSITKAFTAAAILRLAGEGKLSLDDRAGELLPALDGPVAAATVGQLLLHTSGLTGSHGDDDVPLDRDAALAAAGRLRLAFEPGTDHLYSNAGYTLLALVVERVAGGYRDYVTANVLGGVAGGFWNGEPAAPGPRATGYLENGQRGRSGDFAGPHWALEGNGGLAMAMPELARWTHRLFTGDVLGPGARELLRGHTFDLGEGRAEAPGWVAADRSVHGQPVFTTAGGGGETGHDVVVAWLPERHTAIAIASNKPELGAEDLLRRIGPALLAGKPVPRPAPRPDATVSPGAAGRYELADGAAFEVRAAGDRLTVTAHGPAAVAALFAPPDAAALRAHERRVLDLLAGRSQEGRAERAAVESASGPITGVRLAGSVVADGTPRTYVTIVAGGTPLTGWYAVNAGGGVDAAELPARPPALDLVPVGDDRYVPRDPAGTGPRVTVSFGDGTMTVSGPAGSTGARRAG